MKNWSEYQRKRQQTGRRGKYASRAKKPCEGGEEIITTKHEEKEL